MFLRDGLNRPLAKLRPSGNISKFFYKNSLNLLGKLGVDGRKSILYKIYELNFAINSYVKSI